MDFNFLFSRGLVASRLFEDDDPVGLATEDVVELLLRPLDEISFDVRLSVGLLPDVVDHCEDQRHHEAAHDGAGSYLVGPIDFLLRAVKDRDSDDITGLNTPELPAEVIEQEKVLCYYPRNNADEVAGQIL